MRNWAGNVTYSTTCVHRPDVVPAFELRQYVFCDLPWCALDESLWEILAGGYGVSLFTAWAGEGIEQVWVKTADELAGQPYVGARPAAAPRHPIAGADPASCTEQLGVPGPSGERLPLLFVSEIRAIAADTLWLSPFHGRDSVAIH